MTVDAARHDVPPAGIDFDVASRQLGPNLGNGAVPDSQIGLADPACVDQATPADHGVERHDLMFVTGSPVTRSSRDRSPSSSA